MYSVSTSDIMKSYLTRVCNKKIRNGYITLEKKGCYAINKFSLRARISININQTERITDKMRKGCDPIKGLGGHFPLYNRN